LPTDAAGRVSTNIAYTADLDNGVTKGETLGTASFSLDGKQIASVPLVALADSPPAGFMTKLQRKLQKMF
jgi:D-alanyl-D-alanine carboxypeptidase (penicillin-binding protein 5/6)